MSLKIALLLLGLITLTINAELIAGPQLKDVINPILNNDQELIDKDHSKRTIFGLDYDNHGWAKHVKVRGGQKWILGYSPVDLKYVPVIKPILRPNVWKFKQKARPVVHLMARPPKPDMHGWKPILHVPPPSTGHPGHKAWVTTLKPIRPSAPDYQHHHEDEHHHHQQDEDHHHHHHGTVPTVTSLVPTSIPVVPASPTPLPVPSVIPLVSVPLDYHHNQHDYHHDYHHHHQVPHVDYIQPTPQFVYYNPAPTTYLSQVTKPDLPVLPLGASFPVPVGVAPAPLAPHLHFPQAQSYIPIPQTTPAFQITVPDAVREVPAPNLHVHDPHQYDYHQHNHHHEDHVDVPVQATPTATTVEYHGHLAHLINQNYQNYHPHQYIPENYNPNILPGSTGTLSPGFLHPGYTDLQIPSHLPHHPNYESVLSPLPEGIIQPALALEPPID